MKPATCVMFTLVLPQAAGFAILDADGKAVAAALSLTGGRGADTIIEAVGLSARF